MRSSSPAILSITVSGIRRLFYLWIALIGIFCSLVSVAKTNNPTLDAGWHTNTIAPSKISRHFRFYIPKNLQADAPLVILLHGGTQNMEKIFNRHAGASKQWPILAEQHGFVLMAPNGVNSKTKDLSAETRLFQTIGGGHVTPSVKFTIPKWVQKSFIGWQNKDIESADITWQFFERHLEKNLVKDIEN